MVDLYVVRRADGYCWSDSLNDWVSEYSLVTCYTSDRIDGVVWQWKRQGVDVAPIKVKRLVVISEA